VIVIRRIAAQEPALLAGLCELLTDTVDAGGSVGFLAPLPAATAQQYWERVLQATAGALVLWVAEQDGKIVGSVQLALCEKENAPHRADVQKLFVLSAHRGLGIASKLMSEMERFARSAGRTLLVLDTEMGSLAETIYRHFGWQRAGEIPGYALTPHGKLHATVYYFKALAPAP
jgi:GNAT superfamily N-acetyltransferase